LTKLVNLLSVKSKQQILKNAHKLKNSQFSISEDLTPAARKNKQFFLKYMKEARENNYTVKLKKDCIIVDGVVLREADLKKTNWLDFVEASTATRESRKRHRESRSPEHSGPSKATSSGTQGDGDETEVKSGNEQPPFKPGGGVTKVKESEPKRQRSGSRSKPKVT
jgi:hypothetical protein